MPAVLQFPDISNEIFSVSLFGVDFALRWYALAYLVAIIVGWRIVAGLMARSHLWPGDRAPTTPSKIEDLLSAVVIGVVAGGRAGFVLFHQPAYYAQHPQDILKVWEGGMSFHGGFAGVMIAVLWFCRRHRVPVLQLADSLALVAPIGLFLGRLANFVNAELWGRPSLLPWAVIFPGDDAQSCPGIPYGSCARHPSQLYEAGLEGLALGLFLWWLARRGALKRPGLLTGTFLVGYGLARFSVEFFRQADRQFITADNPLGHVVGFAGIGLSMGQLLSVPLILAGVAILIRARRT